MRILITGFVVFVIWSLFSVWLYINKIKPAMNSTVAEQPVQETPDVLADTVAQMDTVMQQEIVMPDNMITYFEFDDASFINTQQTDEHTAEFKKWLDDNPESTLSITGHTDSKGTSEYNLKLGMQRASTMQKYLIKMGIEANRLESTSKGEDEPVADQSTEEGRAKNRRTVITVKN